MNDEVCVCGHPKYWHDSGGYGECTVDFHSERPLGTVVYPCLCVRFKRKAR